MSLKESLKHVLESNFKIISTESDIFVEKYENGYKTDDECFDNWDGAYGYFINCHIKSLQNKYGENF